MQDPFLTHHYLNTDETLMSIINPRRKSLKVHIGRMLCVTILGALKLGFHCIDLNLCNNEISDVIMPKVRPWPTLA